jgi:hypothetical protein
MRPFVLERGKVRIERHRVKHPLHVDEHPLPQYRGVRSYLLHRHLQVLAETVEEDRHARGLLLIALRPVVAVPLHAAEKQDGEEEDNDGIAVTRDETAVHVFDAHKEQRCEREKRDHIPYGVVELAVLGDIGIRIELQTDTSSINVFVDYYDEEDASIILSLESNLHQQFFS